MRRGTLDDGRQTTHGAQSVRARNVKRRNLSTCQHSIVLTFQRSNVQTNSHNSQTKTQTEEAQRPAYGRWVALIGRSVVGVGNTRREAWAAARRLRPKERPVCHFVEPPSR